MVVDTNNNDYTVNIIANRDTLTYNKSYRSTTNIGQNKYYNKYIKPKLQI